MANQVIGLDVEIKVNNALAELRKLSPGADKEAKAIAGSLSKALKDAEKQAAKTGAAMKEVSVRTSSVADKAGTAGANVQKLAGALSLVNPAAAGVAGNIADMADVVEVAGVASEALGVSLASIATIAAPVALAIGALYLAYREYNAELQVSLDKEAESARQMGIHGELSAKVKADREALAIATGTLSQATVDAEAIEADYAARLDKTTAADRARIKEAEGVITARNKTASVDNIIAANAAEADIKRLNARIARTKQESDTGKQAALDLIDYKVAEAEADKHVAANQKAASDAARQRAQAEAEAKAAIQAATAANQQYVGTLRDLDDIGKQALTSQMNAYERLAQTAQEKLDDIDQKGRQAVAQAMAAGADAGKAEASVALRAAAAKDAVNVEYYAGLDKLRADDAAKAEAAAQAEIDKADAARAAELDARKAIAQQSADLAIQGIEAVAQANADASQREADLADGLQAQLVAGDAYYTDAQKAELQKRIEEHRKQARAAFAVAKAARIAEATITTAMAVVNALNDGLATGGPAGLVVGPVAAAAAGVAGGIQIAAIAAEQPSFHQGYAPDERSARVLTSEAVLSPAATAALGSGNIAAANAGIMGGGRQASTPVVFRHQTFRPFIKDFLTQPSALSTALNAGKIVGHRARN
jgi:hypothetical protein